MEELMIKAIRQFKREHKNCEIRSCAAYECSGFFGKVTEALFHIEYCEEAGGEYKNLELNISK